MIRRYHADDYELDANGEFVRYADNELYENLFAAGKALIDSYDAIPPGHLAFAFTDKYFSKLREALKALSDA